MGKGVEDEKSELYLGTTALSSDDFVHRALEAADLIIMLGHDITEKPPVISNGDQQIAHLNFYAADIDDVYKPTAEVIGDISHALWALSERVTPQDHWELEVFEPYRQKQLADTQVHADSADFPLKPQRLVKDMRQALPSDAIVSLDNGMYKIWIARNYPAYEQNTVLLDNALATMGAGLGAGMAAKLLNPERKVVVVAGDGGIMMNIAELETAVRLELDLVVVVVNDSGYGMIKWKQGGMNLPDYGLSFSNPDFIKLAESFGAHGYRVEKTEEFQPLLEKVSNESGVHIIDVPIDYSENAMLIGDNLKNRTT